MLNHVTLLGRLAQDPELKRTQNNTSVTSFDLAVNRPSKDQETPPDYIPVVCWKETAEFVSRFLTKGRQVVVEGRINTRKYTDNDGKNRKAVEVVASRVYFADSKKDTVADQNGQPQFGTPSESPVSIDVIEGDDDLPF